MSDGIYDQCPPEIIDALKESGDIDDPVTQSRAKKASRSLRDKDACVRILPDSLRPLSLATCTLINDKGKRLKRDGVIWGVYRDAATGSVLAANILLTGKLDKKADKLVKLRHLPERAGPNAPQYDLCNIQTLPNLNTHFSISAQPKLLDPALIPDLILRRVCAVLHPAHVHESGIAQAKIPDDAVWQGITLNEIERRDSKLRGHIPDIDWSLRRSSFMPEGLEQSDIDRITRIGANFLKFCLDRKLPVFWPDVRQYPNWPQNFLRFAHGLPDDFVPLNWGAYNNNPGRKLKIT